MFVRPNQFRNSKADVQMFYRSSVWTKPSGVSQIYMMLIGGGSSGNNSSIGGNSGNITTWFGSAQNVPDSLIINPAGLLTTLSTAGNSSNINYRGTSITTLLVASGGAAIAGTNTTDTATLFGNTGLYQNVLGQVGVAGSQTASATTFLSSGCGGGGSTITGNYGYLASTTSSGFFQTQPIIVGVGGAGSTTSANGVGCGGSVTGYGGQGLIMIASW
jgi:hypothetical protein